MQQFEIQTPNIFIQMSRRLKLRCSYNYILVTLQLYFVKNSKRNRLSLSEKWKAKMRWNQNQTFRGSGNTDVTSDNNCEEICEEPGPPKRPL